MKIGKGQRREKGRSMFPAQGHGRDADNLLLAPCGWGGKLDLTSWGEKLDRCPKWNDHVRRGLRDHRRGLRSQLALGTIRTSKQTNKQRTNKRQTTKQTTKRTDRHTNKTTML